MKHTLIRQGERDGPEAIYDRNGDVVLSYCRVCRLGERELDIMPTCKGRPLTTAERDWMDRQMTGEILWLASAGRHFELAAGAPSRLSYDMASQTWDIITAGREMSLETGENEPDIHALGDMKAFVIRSFHFEDEARACYTALMEKHINIHQVEAWTPHLARKLNKGK